MRQLKITKQVTNRDTPSLDKYLQEIGKVDLIPPEEEVLLARRIKSGDPDALRSLVKANLRFVVSVAKQYQNQGMTLPDLINEGNLGLMKAAQRFDETRGFKFISYAVWWIRQAILQALAEQGQDDLHFLDVRRRWIRHLAGLRMASPLSGQRAMTSEAFEKVAPFAPGFGMEVAMTVDALRAGLRVVEIQTTMSHSETGRDLAGFMHRGKQFRDILLALIKRGRI